MKKITLIFALLSIGQFAKAQDTCGSALPINAAGFYVVTAVNGTEVPLPVCAANGTGATTGEWYAYTPTQDYTVTVSTDISQNIPRVDTRFHVYSGTCGALVCVGGDDDSGSNLSSVGIFNVAANNTYYIAFDNKWRPDGFTFQLIESPIIQPIESPVNFTPISLPPLGGGYSICAVDMNNDFLDDIVSVTATNIRVVYQNTNGTFTTTDYPTATAEHTPNWSIAAGDYNKDGYNDLLYGSGQGLTFMKSNGLGTGYIKDNPGDYIFCQRTNFIDINNDGNLDAFSCHDIAPNCYYINNGAGNFTFYQSSVTPGAMSLGSVGGNYATIWTDYDNDGDQDVFVSKCSGPPCELHRNDGNGVFTDISAIAQVNMTPISSWSSAVFDYDNDGDMDVLIGSNGGVGTKFLKNNLDKSNNVEEPFANITAGSGWDSNNTTNRDYIAYDFDNDGFVDVMGGGNQIMFNNGNGTFSPVSYMGMYMGAIGDFNNDGFLDIQNGNTIFRSNGNANKWIKINLKGLQSNSNGIGARVEIYGPFGKQIRDIRSGEGFGYMSTLNAHFGIGTASEITSVVIRWPSGTVDTINHPSSNQALTVVEGSTLAVDSYTNTEFSIAPNPAKHTLNVKWNAATHNLKSSEIYDLNGRLVLQSAVSNNQNISVESIQSGTYIILLRDENGKGYTRKFIKL